MRLSHPPFRPSSPPPALLRRAAALLVTVLMILGISRAALAYSPPPLSGPVTDLAGVLAPADKARIEGKLRALKGTSGPQLAVLILPSLGGETVEDVAYATAKSWKLGDAVRDDGVLLLVATGERKIRIETGKGVGGDLTDLESNVIIRERIGPQLKRGNYAAGIEAGVDAIAAKLSGTAAPPPPAPSAASVLMPLIFLVGAFVVIFLVMIKMLKRSAQRRAGGASGGGYESSSWQSNDSSSSDSGSSGGSDYSGGGGDFGGGGSSGDY